MVGNCPVKEFDTRIIYEIIIFVIWHIFWHLKRVHWSMIHVIESYDFYFWHSTKYPANYSAS